MLRCLIFFALFVWLYVNENFQQGFAVSVVTMTCLQGVVVSTAMSLSKPNGHEPQWKMVF